uniref:C2H2-type domain-containing protein n=1 Tax=Mesocestoides corti TaxID=53468 RepID=A0A5K3EQW8_MESCO
MTDNRRYAQIDVDDIDGGELSLCCICGRTFRNRRSLHLHVILEHASEAPTTSDTPPIAHSSALRELDEVDSRIPLIVDCEGEECSDDSCHPQDLRIRRSPIDRASSSMPASRESTVAMTPRTPPGPSSYTAHVHQEVSSMCHKRPLLPVHLTVGKPDLVV